MQLFGVISEILFSLVGIITMIIGIKFISAKEFFPYHKYVIGKNWEEIDQKIRAIILAVFKMAGSGIICLSLTIFYFVVSCIFTKPLGIISEIIFPLIFLFFWSCSFIITFSVHKKYGANTPWTGSLLSIFLIIIGIILGNI